VRTGSRTAFTAALRQHAFVVSTPSMSCYMAIFVTS
jgi:hypothetical protein